MNTLFIVLGILVGCVGLVFSVSEQLAAIELVAATRKYEELFGEEATMSILGSHVGSTPRMLLKDLNKDILSCEAANQ